MNRIRHNCPKHLIAEGYHYSYWCDKHLEKTLADEPLLEDEELERNCPNLEPCCQCVWRT